jgi:hypothetical protein
MAAGKPAGPVWQLTAQAKQGDGAGGKQADTSEIGSPSPAWLEAAEGVRSTVKWLVTAFAAVGALLFAKGFVTTPQLSWTADRAQLLWAWGLGALGLIGTGVLLWQAVGIMRPTLYELATLDKTFVKVINKGHDKYLPDNCSTIEALIDKYEACQLSIRTIGETIPALQQAVTDAEGKTPPVASDVAKAKATLHAATSYQTQLEADLAIYKKVRQDLLNRAEYWHQDTAFKRAAVPMVLAGIVAALGGIGYQLALATPKRPTSGVTVVPALPAVGELVRADTTAGRKLWDDLSLEACQTDTAARIAVIVSSGKGTAADPYVVSTMPGTTCRAITFTTIDDVARVSVPTQAKITYTPAPTTTPTPAPKKTRTPASGGTRST